MSDQEDQKTQPQVQSQQVEAQPQEQQESNDSQPNQQQQQQQIPQQPIQMQQQYFGQQQQYPYQIQQYQQQYQQQYGQYPYYQQQFFMNPYQYQQYMMGMPQQQLMQGMQAMQGMPNMQNQQFMPQQQQQQMNQLTSQMKKMKLPPKKVVTLEVHKQKAFKEEELLQQINFMDYKCNHKEAHFFMMKSYNEENIVKAITNNLWSSTKDMNQKLNTLYEKTSGKTPIYLFYSINSKGTLEGCAQMISPVNFDGVFEGWSQQGKWFGVFDIEWIFIKEVPNKEFKHITNKLNEGKPVYICKNGQEIPLEQGNSMLKVFRAYQHQQSLVDKVKMYQK